MDGVALGCSFVEEVALLGHFLAELFLGKKFIVLEKLDGLVQNAHPNLKSVELVELHRDGYNRKTVEGLVPAAEVADDLEWPAATAKFQGSGS